MTSPFKYWGKAKTGISEAGRWHLLPYHCLDVAASGIAYLKQAASFRQMLCQRLGMTDNQLFSWVGFWLALHDLGKFATTFQGQRNDILQMLQGRTSQYDYTIRHDSLGQIVWRNVLEEDAIDAQWFGPNTSDLTKVMDHWVRAVMGHHGQPPSETTKGTRPHFHPSTDHQAVRQFVGQMRDLFLADMDWQAPCFAEPYALADASRALSWWIAGLAVLADWIGSNQDYFPYEEDELPCTAYWARTQAQAGKGCHDVGVLPASIRSRATFADLFPNLSTPSPVQRWASDTPLQPGPQIYLLEDVTGAGKTEAAMMLTHRLMSSGAADGFYIGLPTMATANAMYGRLSSFYSRLFEGMASLVLATGQRELVESFAASVLRAGPVEEDQAQADETASARCTAWLADHNKRALLAPAGVGTIDQALMAVLQGKHQSLRMLGLFRKVLIVDEVHACDAYMQGVLEVLLKAHASMGGSAILLSATLPTRMKNAFLAAFAEGCGQRVPVLPAHAAYPLITSWAAAAPALLPIHAVGTRAEVSRTVQVCYASSLDKVVTAIRQALAEGRSVCWMRNTVADAMAAYALFSDELDSDHLMLFHARMTLCDRLDMEGRILEHFGPLSTAELRQARLVIATQVAEQSLDADWDFIVSDLAPIDRLVQRAGRLQRHRRDASGNRLINPSVPDGRPQPCLWVLGPEWAEQPGATWFKDSFPKSSKVYGNHGQLWLTARLLQEGQLHMPADARRLIESVYGETADVPTGLQHVSDAAHGEDMSDASQAQSNTIKLDVGYVWLGEQWWSDAKAPTRLGESSTDVLLCRWDGDRLVPWAKHAQLRHAWAYSTVRVPTRLIAEAVPPTSSERKIAWDETLHTLAGRGKWSVLLALEPGNQGWVGEALGQKNGRNTRRHWVYDERFGLLEQAATDVDRRTP